MNTLVINGSPRFEGYSHKISEHIKKLTNADMINCCHANITHCSGCDNCLNDDCIIPDDMASYYPLVSSADKIIIVSPLYFSMLTGGLLTFASRWQYFYHHPVKSTKKGAVILIGGGSTKDTSKAYSTADIILGCVGVKAPLHADFVGTDTRDPFSDPAFVSKLDEIALF